MCNWFLHSLCYSPVMYLICYLVCNCFAFGLGNLERTYLCVFICVYVLFAPVFIFHFIMGFFKNVFGKFVFMEFQSVWIISERRFSRFYSCRCCENYQMNYKTMELVVMNCWIKIKLVFDSLFKLVTPVECKRDYGIINLGGTMDIIRYSPHRLVFFHPKYDLELFISACPSRVEANWRILMYYLVLIHVRNWPISFKVVLILSSGSGGICFFIYFCSYERICYTIILILGIELVIIVCIGMIKSNGILNF